MRKVSLALPLGVVMVVILSWMFPPRCEAIPAFARQYKTSCSTCHLDFPKLNDFGKAFKDAGFKFPVDDDSMIKFPPVMLGAPAQAELWPHSIWPGRIPGQLPVGLRMNNFFQVTASRNRNNFQFVPGAGIPTGTPPDGISTASNPAPQDPSTFGLFPPRTNFEPGLFSIFTAGNFGSDIAFWVDDDFSVAGANSNGGLGDGYLRFVNLSRFLHMPKDSLSLRFGQFELDLPFSQARTWNLSGWDIYGQNNIGVPGVQFVNNGFTMDSAVQGAELSGGHHYGGYSYSFAVFNQNTTGVTPIPDFVPTVTGSPFQSDSSFKDMYGRFMYRFNLERDPKSRQAVQAAGATGPRDHTYLALGGFYLYGRSVNRLVGTTTVAGGGSCTPGGDISGCVLLTAREPFYRVGADFSFNYRTFNLFGQWMHGRDHNLVPSAFDTTAIGFSHGTPVTFTGGFVEADYLALPWVMLIMRWDAVNSPSDFANGAALASVGQPFFAPVHTTRTRYTPGVQFLIHANIKASFEYQVRPEQQIGACAICTLGTNPLTGTQDVVIRPFRVNTAVAGLEFVY
jgi:hypothetical protein